MTYFDQDCLSKQYFASNLPQAPSNLICLAILVTLKGHAPPLQPAGRVKNFRKVFAGGEGSEIFILVEGGSYFVGGEEGT